MAVSVQTTSTVPVAPKLISATITLDGKDARILRSLLGGLSRKTRREAVKNNGGNKDSANRARFLVTEIFKALDAQGVKRLDEVAITPPDQQRNIAAGRRSGSMY